MATNTHTYSSGVRSSANRPPSRRSTTPLVSTANTPHSAPDTTVHVSNDARECPAVGLPTVTMTATAAASSAAHVHSQRVTRRRVNSALIGSANSSDVTISACTNSTEPRPSAAACSANPTAAQPPLAVAQQPHEQLDVADRFVGDGMCRALMNDVADRDEDRSAESKQDGDIRLRHRRPPVVLDKSVGKCIAKGVGAGCGDLFE